MYKYYFSITIYMLIQKRSNLIICFLSFYKCVLSRKCRLSDSHIFVVKQKKYLHVSIFNFEMKESWLASDDMDYFSIQLFLTVRFVYLTETGHACSCLLNFFCINPNAGLLIFNVSSK